jgi:hypothetical protein
LLPASARRDARKIIKDEWRPPEHSLRQLVHALERESIADYWEKAIRVVRRVQRVDW